MRRIFLSAVVALVLAGNAWGQPVAGLGALCRSAIEAAERSNAIPPRLMAAIARVESGRRDPLTGQWQPWPWTVNAEGEGFFYDTKAQAVAAVRAMQARGVRSIDVGCMQVNLMHHPDAFASLDDAFDPVRNADYAARFLTQLYAQIGAWPKATAMYHSATPDIGAEYERRVMAVWPEEQRLAGGTGGSPLAAAWAATLGRGGGSGGIPPMGRPIGRIDTARTLFSAAGQAGIATGGSASRLAAPGGQPPGRSLDSYRAAPVTLAFRPLRRPG